MIRIHIVTWSNRKRYRKVLERYFRIRHDIYVEQRKWRAVARPINIEMDAFDTEHAIYVLAIDESGKIVGGSRLVPTLQPHLLRDVFPVLATEGPPCGPEILEWTRFFIIRSVRSRGKSSPFAGIVLCGVQEAALKLGIRQISVVCESFWPARVKALGWKAKVLGEVLAHPDGDIVAMLIDVSEAAADSVRRLYGIDGPLLTEDGPPS